MRSSTRFAKPKSVILTNPRASNRMFSGFKSLQQATPSQVRNGMIYTVGLAQGHLLNSTHRYMMLRLCKYSSANVTCVHSRTGDSAEIGYDKIMMSPFVRDKEWWVEAQHD